MNICIITAESESGDHYGPFAFSKKPNKKTLEQLAFSLDGNEDKDGPGDYGSYVTLRIENVEVDEMLKTL